MSVTIDYFFNNHKKLSELGEDLSKNIGVNLQPYKQGDTEDLFCRFLGMEFSLGKHSLENDRECNFEDYTYHLSFRLPTPDAQFQPIALTTMLIVAYALYERLEITGMLVFDLQRLLSCWESAVNPENNLKTPFDKINNCLVIFPHYLDTVRSKLGNPDIS